MAGIKKFAVVLNGFVHDFATGYWLSDVIAIYLLKRFHGADAALNAALSGVERFFFWNLIGAGVVIFATGGMRSFTYVDNFYGAETERVRRRMLIIKHVILLAVIGGGTWWGYVMSFCG